MNKKCIGKAAAAVLLAGTSLQVFATPCDSVLSSYSYYVGASQTASANEVVSNHPECFAGGAATSGTQISATAFTQASAINRAIGARLNLGAGGPPLASVAGAGLAAGGVANNWNVWGNVNQNDTAFRYQSVTNNRVRGENEVLTTVIGGDYALSPAIVVGVSVAFDDGDGWGRTGNNLRNKNRTDGYLIAPYFGYQINREFSLDLSAGMGTGSFKATGGLKAEADRWFAAANLNYNRWMGNWQLTGKASYLHGEEDYGNTKVNGTVQANTGTKNKLDQIRLGAQAAYWMNGLMPFAGLSYTSNVHRSSDAGKDPLGRDTFVATVGLNFFSVANKITAGVFYEQELNRDRSDSRMLSGNVNFRF